MELVSEWFVEPKHEVKASKDPIIYLTPVEIMLLCNYPMQRGLLYTLDPNTQIENNNNNNNNLLDDLKYSLSLTLDHFYPLAGRLDTETLPDEHACTVFIDCNKGPGARLTHVVARHLTVSHLQDGDGDGIQSLFELGEECRNYEGHTRALLSVQVTELVDGVFIGFTANHSVLDGTSFMHFLSVLSEIFFKSIASSGSSKESSLEISRVPVFEQRSIIKLPYLGLKELMNKRENKSKVDRVFHFSSTSMAMIKAQANKGGNDQKISGDEGESVLYVSSFQGLVSLIWRSITRARNLSPDQETVCIVSVNTRTRVDPPLSDDYVGNYVALARVRCTAGELLGRDLGWAAKCLNGAIRSKDVKSIKDESTTMGQLVVTPGFLNKFGADFFGPNHVILGGSPRFNFYGLEFGLGRAIAARMGPGNKTDGKVNASQGREGRGSVELEVTLKEEHMAALEADSELMAFVT